VAVLASVLSACGGGSSAISIDDDCESLFCDDMFLCAAEPVCF
jgi:hypothetical protein